MSDYPELKNLEPGNIKNTVKTLKSLKYTVDDIINEPQILKMSANTVLNRYTILMECGFHNITIHALVKYVTAVNKSVHKLKSLNHIPKDVNVLEKLLSIFHKNIQLKFSDKELEEFYNENVSLKLIRQRLLNEYFKQFLNANDKDLEKIWNIYGRVKHRNFQTVQQIVEILSKDLGFTKDRIIRNAYLLHADPDEVMKILRDVPKINKQSIKDIVYKRPKLLMSTSKALKTSLKHIKDFGISQDAVGRCMEVLTLSPETIRKRLEALQSVAEFKVLSSNPRLLRLVHHQTKAIRRLEYLNQLQIRCTSLHILSCSSQSFAK